MNREPHRKPSGPKPLLFVMLTAAIDSLGLGIIVPVVPELMELLTGGKGLGVAAAWGGFLVAVYATMQFLFAPIMGSLSDRFGRRPVLLLSLLALSFDYFLTGLAPTVLWLFIGRSVAGAAGATYAVANAYAADISTAENRGKYFGYLGAAWSLGFVIGPLIGGFAGQYGPRVPFFVAGSLALLNVLYGLLVLPETLPPESRRPFSLARANILGVMAQMRNYKAVFPLLAVVALFQVAHDSLPSTWSYFVSFQFGWGPKGIGYSLASVGVLGMIVMAVISPWMIARFGEQRSALTGMLISGIGFTGISTATEDWQLYAWLLPWSLMGLIMPSLRSIMTQHVPANAQGELQGALTSAMGLSSIFTPLMMTQLFYYFSDESAVVHYPGASMLAAGIALFCALVITVPIFVGTLIGRGPASLRLSKTQ